MNLKEYILTETKTDSLDTLKATLMKAKKYQYGCYFAEIKCKGFSVSYNSNDNCFASFIITIPFVGMASSYGLDKESITAAGKIRGCDHHYLSDKQLNTIIK